MSDELKDRRIIVTGGASGMGAAMVRDFVAQGARVASLDRDQARNAEAAAGVKGAGQVQAIACDVSDKVSVDRAFAQAVGFLGGLNALVHAAGIAPGAPAEAITLEAWDEVFAINTRGTFLTNQAAFGYLKDNGGRILNFASAAGVRGLPNKAHYAASKAAVLGWTRTVAREWARYEITVNAILPGIHTPMYDKTRSLMSPETLAAHDAQQAINVPLGGKLGDAERDFVPVMRFLVGDGPRFMTGQMFAIDGGTTAVR